MNHRTLSVCVITLLGVLTMAADNAPSGVTVRNAQPGKPESWAAAAQDLHHASAGLARSLMAIGTDEKRPGDDRIAAIIQLGAIRNAESTRFLIENVTLRIEPKYIGGDDDAARAYPARYALSKGDWGTAQEVIKSLKEPGGERQLFSLSVVLRDLLGERHARAMLDDQIARTRHVETKKNLTSIRAHLPER